MFSLYLDELICKFTESGVNGVFNENLLMVYFGILSRRER